MLSNQRTSRLPADESDMAERGPSRAEFTKWPKRKLRISPIGVRCEFGTQASGVLLCGRGGSVLGNVRVPRSHVLGAHGLRGSARPGTGCGVAGQSHNRASGTAGRRSHCPDERPAVSGSAPTGSMRLRASIWHLHITHFLYLSLSTNQRVSIGTSLGSRFSSSLRK